LPLHSQSPPSLTRHFNRRIVQGIPGIERAPNGRLWALCYAGGPAEPSEGPGKCVK
jgi:hypothetical protein